MRNVCYADLSDYFYVWLRKCLRAQLPGLFATMLVPKTEELVATPYRFDGDKGRARDFFQEGFRKTFSSLNKQSDSTFPQTVFYAFKQSDEVVDDESEDSSIGQASTGWDSMLEGIAQAGSTVHGTWPLRTEMSNRSVARDTNALASSIAVICRQRAQKLANGTRRDFISQLKRELPGALRKLQTSSIAPVDLAQAAIGPGMAVFSSFGKVLESSGEAMSVRTALVLINQVLDEVLSEQEGQYDPDTRWAISWFEQHAFDESTSGDAITLCSAKNTSLDGLVSAGIVAAKAGKTRLLRREEFPSDWDPKKDNRLTVWEATQHLIRALEEKGEAGFAEMSKKLGPVADEARNLAYRLYSICERNGWAEEAQAYNALVVIWSEALQAA